MEDRYKFRCGISTSYFNEEDEEKEISLVIEPADVFLSQSTVSIWHDDLRKLLEEKIAGTEHEEYLENIMDSMFYRLFKYCTFRICSLAKCRR